MEIVKVLNTISPRGFKEYIDYNIAVFEGAEKVFKIAYDYGDQIMALAKETDSWYKTINNDQSWFNATRSISRGMDVNSYLDYQDRMKKREAARRQYDRDRYEINRNQ